MTILEKTGRISVDEYLRTNYNAKVHISKDTNAWCIDFPDERHYNLFCIKYSEFI